MTQKITMLVIATVSFTLSGLANASTFNNGGFENKNLSGWTQGGGKWTSGNAPLNPANFAGGTPNNTIQSSGTDAITGANTVYGGNYSVRVGDSSSGANVSTISQSVTNYTDNNIFFAWNAVLEESHGLTDSGHFSLNLRDDTTGLNVISRGYSSAGAIGSGTQGVTWNTYTLNTGENWFSSGWVVENIDLLALNLVGHNFTLSLLAADCYLTGHGGYAYLDGFGAVNPPVGPSAVPVPGAVWLFGSALLGFAGFGRRKSV
jgi:hypothetical protein